MVHATVSDMKVIASRSRGTLVAVAEKCFLLDGLSSPPPYSGHPIVT